MAGIQTAEAKKPKQQPKVLDHLSVHPKMGGGHIVKHHYTSYQHEPMEVHFNDNGKAKGGEHISAHLAKHAGLPPMESADGGMGDEAEQENRGE